VRADSNTVAIGVRLRSVPFTPQKVIALKGARSSSGVASRKVRLDCNGELVGIGSVDLVGLRQSPLGAELIEFVCPRCDRHHESLRFD